MANDEITVTTAIRQSDSENEDKSSSSSGSSGDEEKGVSPTNNQLQRKLKSRHLQMIAIGGTIGTGLFIGSGEAVSKSGPAGALIAYVFVGSIVYSVMQSLGEMATYIPISGAFSSYATRFVDANLGFAMGWIYWFSWAMTFALELTATGIIIQYWKDLPIAIFIGIFWVVITVLNCFPVSFYGEIEFWLSTIKVVTVIGFIIFAIAIDAGVGQQGVIGFQYWKNPGAFADYLLPAGPLAKFVGFWAVIIQAGFSYQGTELVGIAAGETENPRKNVPAAIRKTFYRILIFFVATVFCIGLLVPSNNPDLLSGGHDATASPFVIACKLAGVRVLPSIINGVLLSVVLSAANSNVYSGSRILLGLAEDGAAPAFLKKTSKHGVPYYAVAFTAAFGLLGFLNLSEKGSVVFSWFVNISGVAGFLTWTGIGISHVGFMRALAKQGVGRDTLPYESMWQPFFAWYGIVANIIIILTQGFTAFMPWNVKEFFISYISLILFVILYVGHKIVTRKGFVEDAEADIQTGCTLDDDTTWNDTVPTTWYGKFMAWLL